MTREDTAFFFYVGMVIIGWRAALYIDNSPLFLCGMGILCLVASLFAYLTSGDSK